MEEEGRGLGENARQSLLSESYINPAVVHWAPQSFRDAALEWMFMTDQVRFCPILLFKSLSSIRCFKPISAFENTHFKKLIEIASKSKGTAATALPSGKLTRQAIMEAFTSYMTNLKDKFKVCYSLS
jgi:hypothetical protein